MVGIALRNCFYFIFVDELEPETDIIGSWWTEDDIRTWPTLSFVLFGFKEAR